MKHITVLGEGAWGTALASILSHNGYNPLLWAYHQDTCDEINTHHTNTRFMQGIQLPATLHATTDIEHALSYASIIIVALPTNYIRHTLENHTALEPKTWIIGSKGLEENTQLVSFQIIDQLFPADAKSVIAGPSFAHDVIKKQPTGLVAASTLAQARQTTIDLFKNDYITLQESTDMIGVQYASVCKNIYAIGMGLLKGAGFEDNTCSLYLIKALEEMQTIIAHVNGDKQTMYGLAGLGDLYLTASSLKSKNMRFGYILGQGKTFKTVVQEFQTLPEGVHALKSLQQLQHTIKTELVLAQAIHAIIFNNQSITMLIAALV